jgi:hypothetical protein
MDPEAWPVVPSTLPAGTDQLQIRIPAPPDSLDPVAPVGAGEEAPVGSRDGRMTDGRATDRRRPLPYRPAQRRRPVRLPVVLTVLAIVLAAAAGVSYVISPDWLGRDGPTADVGAVPTAGGTLVGFVAPRRIVIPRLHASAPIVSVGTNHRELTIPVSPKVVGWWSGGAKPGQRTGTALLAGHINYAGTSGVLARIATLRPDDRVYVTGSRHGRLVRLRFRITGVRTYPKSALPYRQIFDQHSAGRLAIVTCGGPFDARTGNYRDNVVAFAVPS